MENLDCMDPADLMKFWGRYHRPSRGMAAALFDGQRPKGYIRATRDLANYASNKATAMRCRLKGDIPAALMYEGICDRIYDSLPEFARW